MAQGLHILTDLDTLGVSLVKRGANKKKFAITKAEGDLMENLEIVKSVIETEADNEEQHEAVLKALSPKAQGAVKGMLRIASAFKDELPKDIMAKLADMCGYEVPEEKKTKADDMPKDEDKEEEEEEMSDKKAAVKTADDLTDLPPQWKDQIEAIWKSQKEAVEKAAHLESVLKAERDDRLQKEFVAKAATTYPRLPGKAEDLGLLLKSVYDADAKLGSQVEAVLKAAHDVIATGDVLAEVGTSRSVEHGGAWQKIEQMAASFVEKSAGGVNRSAAIAKVIETHPELYNEYLAENPAQVGRA